MGGLCDDVLVGSFPRQVRINAKRNRILWMKIENCWVWNDVKVVKSPGKWCEIRVLFSHLFIRFSHLFTEEFLCCRFFSVWLFPELSFLLLFLLLLLVWCWWCVLVALFLCARCWFGVAGVEWVQEGRGPENNIEKQLKFPNNLFGQNLSVGGSAGRVACIEF